MKTSLFALLFVAVVLVGCQDGEKEKTYLPRTLVAGEDFNSYAKNDETPFTVLKLTDADALVPAGEGPEEIFTVKFRDTTVQVQPDEADKGNVKHRFSLAQFVNTQKTSLLVQIADSSNLVAPYYLLTLKNDQVEVVNLYRPSKGESDVEITKGMVRVGSSGYLINNDYFITNVNAKIYPLKRQNPEERIQGEYFMNSPDKKTFVFLMADAFYEVHYPTNETFIVPFNGAPSNKSALYAWVQSNFSWQKNNKGISFLKQNADDNRIIDIKEFK
ncbi:hypothetical protein [Pedobacter immunditicola]|uniref:hypothetical protein n=1 Tax=Pedobacter immunditicola TaxID=3133440 RepID=UPI0030A23329